MPEANLAAFNLEGLDAAQLEQRRRDIIARYSGKDIDAMSNDDLRELSALTGALRRKTTSTLPRASSKAKSSRAKKATSSLDDIANLL